MSRSLARLAELATTGFHENTSVNRALGTLKRRLRASEVSLVYGAPDGFRRFSTAGATDLSDMALWLINRDLTSRGVPVAFQFERGRVLGFRPLEPGTGCDYVASTIPLPNSSAQMLVARGPWPGGPAASVAPFMVASGPALSQLLQRRLNFLAAESERGHIGSLMNITNVMSESVDLEEVLVSMAGTIATVGGVDYVTIDLTDAEHNLRLRCVNYRTRRQDAAAIRDRWREGGRRPDPVRAAVISSRRPILLRDIQNDERVPQTAREFFIRTLVRSAAVFPLLAKDDVLGVISFGSVRPLEFDQKHVDLLEGLAAQVATAVKGIELYGELQEKSAQLEQALDIEREHARRDSLTGVLNHAAITERLRELISDAGPSAVTVAMVDVDGMKAVNDTFGHVSGDGALTTVARALDAGDRAIVGRYGGDEFLVVLPGATRADAEQYRATVMHQLARATVKDDDSGTAIPIVVSIGLASYPEEAGTIVDLIKLSDGAMYSDKWKRTIARGDTGSQARDERAAKIVGSLVPLLTSPGEVDQKLTLVAQRLSAEGGYDTVECQLFDSPTGPPIAQSNASTLPDLAAAAEAWAAEQRSPTRRRLLRPILARTKRPIILNDLQSDARLSDRERELLRAAGLHSGIVAPMFWQDELIGILAVAKKEEHAFEARDAQFLAAVASQVTVIVRMATLVERLQAASTRLASAQGETVMMLAAAAEAHDRTTGKHLQSIRALTEALARELGYGEDDLTELGLASTLHDIGKISVPDAILSSPLRFDTDDWEVVKMWDVMKQHSIWGYEFLTGRAGFDLAASVARWHHERWDGGGYPDGLRGDAIPQDVAIVTVADAFDAMICDRPYRPGRPASAAIREIVEHSAKQFNPRVVEALLRLHARGDLPLIHPADHAEAA